MSGRTTKRVLMSERETTSERDNVTETLRKRDGDEE